MYLYMFYLGGNAGRSNIEVHDIQFVAAEQPEHAWPALREAWFGDADKVHIDGYARINWADGYAVSLSATPAADDKKLFFVNAGAYDPSTLAELHAFDLFVARDAQEAKVRGLESLLNGALHQHKDNLKDVDDCILLDKIGDLYVHLTPSSHGKAFRPEWQGYQPIGL
ncbi:hypothetical protein BS639_13160 [Rouxiella silvae]|uniref:DUF1543 domain-containing protein n=1 Tax=Rouxiella silvae TaxID=1646373 RepID=A0AA40X3E5_9GAMM|nr:DUF1543 domain-containing protein [Rouxiella silvae]KQN46603.1 hypothetical protein ASE93_15175 [Serratia sp. Leaf50]MBF6637970.1 DUF1543 domain-containing protein [Rouxiella silvae]ORJ20798.1 hypothetical protein BS639_13160 [Rouxiella silvae]